MRLASPMRLIYQLWNGSQIFQFPNGTNVIFWYNVEGGKGWMQEKATATADGRVFVDVLPRMITTHGRWRFYFGIKLKDGTEYEPNGILDVQPSPGAYPNQIPTPPQHIEWNGLENRNPEMSPFMLKADDPTSTANEALEKANQALATKVDKVSGKGLSTNDFDGAWIERIESAEGDIIVIRNIAQGKKKAVVFDTETQMREWLGVPANVAFLDIGDDLYIRDTEVPDYWWDGEEALELGAGKVDLSALLFDNAESADILPVATPTLFTTLFQMLRNWQKWMLGKLARMVANHGWSPAEWFTRTDNGDGTCTITGMSDKAPINNPLDIWIPSVIDGMKVTAVSFDGNPGNKFFGGTINSMRGDNVVTVSANALRSCNVVNLAWFTFPKMTTNGSYSFDVNGAINLFVPSLTSLSGLSFSNSGSNVYFGLTRPSSGMIVGIVTMKYPRGAWSDTSPLAGMVTTSFYPEPWMIPYIGTQGLQNQIDAKQDKRTAVTVNNGATESLAMLPNTSYTFTNPVGTLDLSGSDVGLAESSLKFTSYGSGATIALPVGYGWAGAHSVDPDTDYILIISDGVAVINEVFYD